MSPRFVALLSHRRLPLIAAMLATVLVLPSLGLGIVLDDYLQRAALLKIRPYSNGSSAILTLFDFIPPETKTDGAPPGLFTWYRSPNLRIGFPRPLSAATHVLDYALWPDNFPLQHAHQLVWFAVAVLLVGLFYRRLGGTAPAAGLAVLMFAVEDSHSLPAAWLANRNGLIALVFGAITLLMHLGWRRERSRAALFGALAALAAGLMAAEAAIAVFAYLAAYQLFVDEGAPARRLVRLAPYFVLILVWRAVYVGMGFGTFGCGAYIDPATSPLRFLANLPGRMSLLLVSQWLQAQTELLALMASSASAWAGGAAGLAAIFLVVLFWPLLRQDREARFWGLAMVLCLVPISAAFVMDRNLIFAGIGAFGLLGLMARETGLLGGPATITGWRRTATRVLVFLHLWLALALLPLRVLSIPYGFGAITRISEVVPAQEWVSDKTVVWVNGNDFFTFYGPLVNTVRGLPRPRASWQLGFMGGGATVRRTGDRSLLITQDEGFLPRAVDMLLWSPEHRFRVGQRIPMPEFEAEVKEVLPDGRPRAVEFTFNRSLDAPDFLFMCFNGMPEICGPPAIGGEMRLAGFTFDFLSRLRGKEQR